MQRSIVFNDERRGDALVNAFDSALADRLIENVGGYRYIRSEYIEPRVETHIWMGFDEDEEIRLVEDEIMSSCYALIRSKNYKIIFRSLRQQFITCTPNSLIDYFQKKPEKLAGRLMLIPLSADGKITASIRKFLHNITGLTEPEIQTEAIHALTLFRDAKSRPLIQAILSNEPADQVMAAALFALQTIPE